MVSTQNRLQ